MTEVIEMLEDRLEQCWDEKARRRYKRYRSLFGDYAPSLVVDGRIIRAGSSESDNNVIPLPRRWRD